MRMEKNVTPLDRIEEMLGTTDLTLDPNEDHCINLTKLRLMDRILESIPTTAHMEFRQSPVVSVHDNFDRLQFPADNLGRSSVYTRYADENTVLRTHTSAMVPPLFDKVASGEIEVEDTLFFMPGLVFRRDVKDRTHLGEFHQMDVWRLRRIEKGQPRLDNESLMKLAQLVCEAANPGENPIFYDTSHPYTLNGIEVHSHLNGVEMEIFEAGLIHPGVLENCGLNPEEYDGYALGMGIERLVMAKKQLPDIRFLRATNPNIAEQMYDLEPFNPVPTTPAMKRDLSFVSDPDLSEEDIADIARVAAKQDEKLIESVEIIATTNFAELNEKIIDRIGIKPGQVNYLVRAMLRHPDRTLTKKDSARIYSRIYDDLHKGASPAYSLKKA